MSSRLRKLHNLLHNSGMGGMRTASLAFAWAACAGVLACAEASRPALPELDYQLSIPGPMSPGTEQELDPIAPIPLFSTTDYDDAKVRLGRMLFKDKRLSGDGTVACTDCHLTSKGMADGRRVAELPTRPTGAVNVPTLFNVAFNQRLNWTGAFRTLADHHDRLIEAPAVMASTWDTAASKLAPVAEYRAAFGAAYPDGLTRENVRDALIAYERSLVTPGARFDRYLRGDQAALSPLELEGYALFQSYGCISCHQGRNLGGNLFEKLGIMRDYFADRGDVKPADFGRFNVTKLEKDKFKFRVPSLRNVALTAPYFHDGTAETLDRAVDLMSQYQLGRSLSRGQITRIVAFLETLTGEYREDPVAR